MKTQDGLGYGRVEVWVGIRVVKSSGGQELGLELRMGGVWVGIKLVSVEVGVGI